MQHCLDTGTKVCSRCGEQKLVTEFYKDHRREDGLRSVCKQCWSHRQKAYRSTRKAEISESGKRYYRANKEHINRRVSNWRKDNRERLTEQQRERRKQAQDVLTRLKKPCAKCGDARPWVIHFHHIDPSEKVFEVTKEAVMYKKEDCIIAEVEKCACLCANCHTEFHHFYGKNPAEPKADFERYLGGEVHERST